MLWFYYRNNLKQTYPDTFTSTCDAIPLTFASSQLLSQLEQLREKICSIITDESMEPDQTNDDHVQELLDQYIRLFIGFIFVPKISKDKQQQATDEFAEVNSPLSRLFRFKWTDSIVFNTKISANDTLYELCSILTAYSVWLMKWSDNISKILPLNYLPQHISVIQKILRRASGLFRLIGQKFHPKIPEELEQRIDSTNIFILKTYYYQCMAEGWELWFLKILLTMVTKDVNQNNAIKLKPYGGMIDPKIITQLSLQIFTNFSQSFEHLRLMISELKNNQNYSNLNRYTHWFSYLELKSLYYQIWNSMANCYDQWLQVAVDDLKKFQSKFKQDLHDINMKYKELEKLTRKYNSNWNQYKQGNRIDTRLFLQEQQLYMKMLYDHVERLQQPFSANSIFNNLDNNQIRSMINIKDIEPIQHFDCTKFDEIWMNMDFYSEFGVHLPMKDAELLAEKIRQQQEYQIEKKNRSRSPVELVSRLFQRREIVDSAKRISPPAAQTNMDRKSPLPYRSPRKIPVGFTITPIPTPDPQGKIPTISAPLIIPKNTSKITDDSKTPVSPTNRKHDNFTPVKNQQRQVTPATMIAKKRQHLNDTNK